MRQAGVFNTILILSYYTEFTSTTLLSNLLMHYLCLPARVVKLVDTYV